VILWSLTGCTYISIAIETGLALGTRAAVGALQAMRNSPTGDTTTAVQEITHLATCTS